ncbi:MAG: YceI family protein [Pseudomonadota bacterium]
MLTNPITNRKSRSSALVMLAAPVFLLANASAPLTFALDSSASSVSAKVPFLGLGSKTAKFPKMNGTVSIVPDAPQRARINVTFDARQLEAPDSTTLSRLRGEKFFWVEKYPTIRFVGNSLKMKNAKTGTVRGKLTARGVTRDETLEVTFDQAPTTAPAGTAVAFTGDMTIDRRQYGMKSYQLIVGNKVKISLRARMVPN